MCSSRNSAEEIPRAGAALAACKTLASSKSGLCLWTYAQSLYEDTSATLDDLNEAVTTLEDTARIARRVMGGAHPLTTGIEGEIRDARAALRARESNNTHAT